MKILTVMVPCYNSQDYMEKCIDSLLTQKDDIEILIINDGSTDGTGKIAENYEKDYPDCVKAIHQENKGHGGAINTGISLAEGKYFKVVDSDDYLEKNAFDTVIKSLKSLENLGKTIDMHIANYVYDKKGKENKKVMHYPRLPKNQIFTWEEGFKLKQFEYILMHSIIYRTQLLRDSGMVLPEKVSYEDCVYAFVPLEYVEKMYYDNVNLYMYFIGRDDQSVNEKMMIKKRSNYSIVTKIMIDSYCKMDINSKPKKKYLIHFLDMMMCLSTLVLVMSGTDEDYEQKDILWNELKKKDKKLYKAIKRTFFGIFLRTGKFNRKNVLVMYKIARKIYGFN